MRRLQLIAHGEPSANVIKLTVVYLEWCQNRFPGEFGSLIGKTTKTLQRWVRERNKKINNLTRF